MKSVRKDAGGGRRRIRAVLAGLTLASLAMLGVGSTAWADGEIITADPDQTTTQTASPSTSPTTPDAIVSPETVPSSKPSTPAPETRDEVTVTATDGTTLKGRTIEFRRIGVINDQGGMNADNDAAKAAAAKAGGSGEDAVSSLFSLMLQRKAYTDKAAPILYDAVKAQTPDATHAGEGRVELASGWYVVNVKGSDALPQLVVAGETKHDGVVLSMLDGKATLDGDTDPNPEQPARNGLLNGLTSLFAQRAAETWGWGDTYDAPNGATTAIYTWNGPYGSRGAFCMEPDLMLIGNNGFNATSSELDDDRIRTILYYGSEGPASIFTNTQGVWGQHVDTSRDTAVWATHIALGVTYEGRSYDYYYSRPGLRGTDLAGYSQLMWLRDNHPLSRQVKLTAYKIETGYTAGGSKQQDLVSWTYTPSRIEAVTYLDNGNQVKADRTQHLQDKIVITPRDGGWAAGEQLLVCTDLNYDDTPDGLRPDGGVDGKVDWGLRVKSKCVIANPDRDVPQDTGYDVWSEWFTPGDFDWSEWQPGRYWFNTYFDTYHNADGSANLDGTTAKYAHQFNFDNFKINGKEDGNEGLTLMTLTGSTQAQTADGKAIGSSNTPAYGSTTRVKDRVNLQATPRFKADTSWLDGTYSGNRCVTAHVYFYYRANKDGSGFDATKEKTMQVWTDTGDSCGTGADFGPSDVGLTSWTTGKYWFDVTIFKGDDVVETLQLKGENDPAESWTIDGLTPYWFSSTKAQATFPIEGGTGKIHDDVIAKGNMKVNVNAKATLNWASGTAATKAEKTKTVDFTMTTIGTTSTPEFGPGELGMTKWQAGRYWWTITVPVQTYVPSQIVHDGLAQANQATESWVVAKSETMKLWTTSQAANGIADQWNNNSVSSGTGFTSRSGDGVESNGEAGRTGYVKTNLVVEGSTAALTDRVRLQAAATNGSHHDWDTNSDHWFDQGVTVTVETTLHTPMGTKAKRQTYNSYWSNSGFACGAQVATGCREFSFSPSDLNAKEWAKGDYWFTSRVVSVNAKMNGMSCPAGQTGFLGVTGSYRLCVNEGMNVDSNDRAASEQVSVAPHIAPDIDSQVSQTVRDDGLPVSDKVTVTVKPTVTGLTVKARGVLYWSPQPGTKANTVPKDARKVADLTPITFAANQFKLGTASVTYTPAGDPNLKNVKGLGTGWYTYVWRIEKADLMGQKVTYTWNWRNTGWQKSLTYSSDQLLARMAATVSDGWRPDTEQTRMDTKWNLKVTKVAHAGNANGKWYEDHPAIGAVLHLQETTDQTGRTLKQGTSASTITLDGKGEGTFPWQVISPGQTRWYRVWESKVDKPLNVPKNNAYWIVTVTNQTGTTGVKTLVTRGSSEETSWLVKGSATGTPATPGTSQGSGLANQPSSWHQTLGDTLDANIMPPVTGARGDTGLTLLLAGLGGLAALSLLAVLLDRLTARKGRHGNGIGMGRK